MVLQMLYKPILLDLQSVEIAEKLHVFQYFKKYTGDSFIISLNQNILNSNNLEY